MAHDQHLPRTDSDESAVYQIRIKGQLGAQWGAWFDGMTIMQTANGETLITGLVADQAALYGLLRKVGDLGLPLLSVSCRELGSLVGPAIDGSCYGRPVPLKEHS